MQRLFSDKGRSVRQAILRTIINTEVHSILETLLVSFEMARGILKEHRVVHMRVNASSGSSTKKKKNNIK